MNYERKEIFLSNKFVEFWVIRKKKEIDQDYLKRHMKYLNKKYENYINNEKGGFIICYLQIWFKSSSTCRKKWVYHITLSIFFISHILISTTFNTLKKR